MLRIARCALQTRGSFLTVRVEPAFKTIPFGPLSVIEFSMNPKIAALLVRLDGGP
jgi:hypothetical protein